jgi:hypothetical protein
MPSSEARQPTVSQVGARFEDAVKKLSQIRSHFVVKVFPGCAPYARAQAELGALRIAGDDWRARTQGWIAANRIG